MTILGLKPMTCSLSTKADNSWQQLNHMKTALTSSWTICKVHFASLLLFFAEPHLQLYIDPAVYG